eukprot:TRINITY_DN6054_c0_g1_i1.p1 TRINITY_DN6054_c0_g1~~TRINITY_DN6054_c0_g1_i1.p1  ORF type:complete len:199 (-),score=79.86 TRINITY_DN6054_c0_g1_i1:98-694(-)
MAACLSARWLVTPEWIYNSALVGAWVFEDQYGRKIEHHPISKQKVFITPSFLEDNKEADRVTTTKTLLKIAACRVTKSQVDAQIVLIGSADHHSSFSSAICLTFDQLLVFIMAGENPLTPPKKETEEETQTEGNPEEATREGENEKEESPEDLEEIKQVARTSVKTQKKSSLKVSASPSPSPSSQTGKKVAFAKKKKT